MLVLALIFYFALHSFLATRFAKERILSFITPTYYRLCYNVVALVLLLPVGYYYQKEASRALFAANMFSLLLGGILMVVGFWVMWMAMKHYNTAEFIGTYQLKNQQDFQPTQLNESGWNAWVRHPLYFGALFLIWGAVLFFPNTSVLKVAITTTAYLIVGTYLEERKLLQAFGTAYLNYQKRVPMLLPFPFKRK